MRLKILGNSEDSSKDTIFNIYLDDAKHIALNRIYPFDREKETLPARYTNWQTRCAVELYNRLGDEGVISYSENGLSYTYENDLVSKELLSELIPKVGVPYEE